MNNIVLTLPIIIPMLTGIAALLAYKSRTAQRGLNIIGSAALLTAAIWLLIEVEHNGIRAAQIGNWQAPFGITLVADLLSAIMVTLAGIIGFAVAVYSLATVDQAHENLGYHQLYQFLLMGVCGAFLTGDLFNLYVWFEVMLMSSFVLLALGGQRGQMEGAIKYVTLNLISSAIFLAALGLLYGTTGTLNMADLANKISTGLSAEESGWLTTLSILFLVAFGIKAAVFPLFFWLPASYHTPPVAVSAIFAGLLTKVGVYALIRVFTLIFIQDTGFTHNTVILVIAGLTMVTGVLGAVAQGEFRRVLSFHIISQIGYMVMGLGLFTPLALAGSVFYIAHHIIVKTNLFLVSGVVKRLHGTLELKKLGGLYQHMPMLGILFLIPALSLAGIPPLSGFFAKLSLVQAGLEKGEYFIVTVSLAVSLLTIFSMMKLWNEAFWKTAPQAEEPLPSLSTQQWATLVAPIAVLAVITVVIGLGASPAFALALRASEQLMDPSAYIRAVLEITP